MYDSIRTSKAQLFSWRWFLLKLVPVVVLIILTGYLQLTIKWNNFTKNSATIFLITSLLIYVLWLEFYQTFHIISFFGNIIWTFDSDEYIWSLDIESRRTRLYNNYVAICLLAKFWHLVFIFTFWIFFVLRLNEFRSVRYALLAANHQNFIILYIMSWIYMLPWAKFILRKQFDNGYFWFFSNSRAIATKSFFFELKLLAISSVPDIFFELLHMDYKFAIDFFRFLPYAGVTDGNQYRKAIVRDLLLFNLNTTDANI